MNSELGFIIFPSHEPFGKYIFDKLSNSNEDYSNENTYNNNQKAYVLKNLYSKTKSELLLEYEANQYILKGSYQGNSRNSISIGSFDLPRGSVRVFHNGTSLIEGIDYTVNYDIGSVYIINEVYKDLPLTIETQNRSLLGGQNRNFFGTHLEHEFSEDLKVGSTFLSLNERTVGQKNNFNKERIKNKMYGINSTYENTSELITELVNRLPFTETSDSSRYSITGEFAYLSPNLSYDDSVTDAPYSYIDDFESSAQDISILGALGWKLASVPDDYGGEYAKDILDYGYKRAKMSWFTIHPDFYNGSISDITTDDVSLKNTRLVEITELFPEKENTALQTSFLNTLNVSYYPSERGPYNYNPVTTDQNLSNPEENWGGIMRELPVSNFERENIQYIKFWILDPFTENSNHGGGKLNFDLGFISEDILKDGFKMYENGMPLAGDEDDTYTTNWGKVPSKTSYNYFFNSNNEEDRLLQDIGFDGLSNDEEKEKFSQFSQLSDPSSDDYISFRQATGGVIERYRNYNGLENNTPFEFEEDNPGSSYYPDVEDIDMNNNMNTINNYYRYTIGITPNMDIGDSYITDIRNVSVEAANGDMINDRWLQFKIPIQSDDKISFGNISDIRSLKFMRFFLSDFSENIVIRFGDFSLVRGTWRISENLNNATENYSSSFDVSSVNLFENDSRIPIPYKLPPGINTEQLFINNASIQANEQSLSINFKELISNGENTVFKSVLMDMRQYKKLSLYIHAEEFIESNNQDENISAIIRIGFDNNSNYYEILKPLKYTSHGETSRDSIWPEYNRILMSLDVLTKAKEFKLNSDNPEDNYSISANELDKSLDSSIIIKVVGNPTLANVNVITLGVKNISQSSQSGEIWFNEMSLVDYKNSGGWAGNIKSNLKIANLAEVSSTISMQDENFGSLESTPSTMSLQSQKNYNVTTNINAGILFPEEMALTMPVKYSISQQKNTSKYDALNDDLLLDNLIEDAETEDEKQEILERSTMSQKNKIFEIIGIKKNKNTTKKPHFYDIENLELNYISHNSKYSDFEYENKEQDLLKIWSVYRYDFRQLKLQPFRKMRKRKNDYLKIIKDLNLNLLPKSVYFNVGIDRSLDQQEFRIVDATIDPKTYYSYDYQTNWEYKINYKLTKSIDISYNVKRTNLIEDLSDSKSNNINENLFQIGNARRQEQLTTLTYALPIYKIPLLSFFSAKYDYKGRFSWEKKYDSYENVVSDSDGQTYNLGSFTESSQNHKINISLTLSKLYNKIGLKSIKKKKSKNIKEQFLDFITGIETAQISYQIEKKANLPGILSSVSFLGIQNPSFLFGLGLDHDDIEEKSAQLGILTEYPEFNDPFVSSIEENIKANMRGTFLNNISVTLFANQKKISNTTENFIVNNSTYTPTATSTEGSFSTSIINLRNSSFSFNNDFNSRYIEMIDSRIEIANLLAENYYGNTNFERDNNGFPEGFSENSQQVLIGSFLKSNFKNNEEIGLKSKPFTKIPIPNWRITINNVEKLLHMEKVFKSISFSHSYDSKYSVDQYYNNVSDNVLNSEGDVIPDLIIPSISITQNFNPLAKIDFNLKKGKTTYGVGYTKQTTTTLNLDNNTLNENFNSGILFTFSKTLNSLKTKKNC